MIVEKFLCGLVAMMALVLPAAAQNTVSVPSTVVEPSIRFDVVSIKVNKDRSGPRGRSMPADGDGMIFTNQPMLVVILTACRFSNYALTAGLPDWTMTERYDVAVKVSGENVAAYHALTSAQRGLMLRRVLEDQLKLKAHLEPRPTLVYDLVVAKNGSKLKVATPGDTYAGGFKAAPGQTILFTPPSRLVGQGATVAELAARLSDMGDYSIGRQVYDKSGLTGRYDFTLQWTPDMKGAGDADAAGAVGGSGPSLFTAVQEQLGLRLDSVKEPVEWLVIDHVERPAED